MGDNSLRDKILTIVWAVILLHVFVYLASGAKMDLLAIYGG